jgi:hypothetical protein
MVDVAKKNVPSFNSNAHKQEIAIAVRKNASADWARHACKVLRFMARFGRGAQPLAANITV